ncbi:MAG: hypothetical protein ACFCU6_01305 [Balneolaceae bacterium]
MNIKRNLADKRIRQIWLWSVACFILAGFTGFIYRWSLIAPAPFGIELQNIRHAHSHLMFFCWITPVPMVFITRFISGFTTYRIRSLINVTWVILILGLLSYPFFLLYGYRSADLGFAELPVSVIISGLIMIVWYFYIWYYIQARKKTAESISGSFYDAALFMLAISSAGAWGVAVIQFTAFENPFITTALTQFFLVNFTEGWAVLMAVGLMYEYLGPENPPVNINWLIAPVMLGVPLLFPFGMSQALINPALLFSAKAGAVLVSGGLLMNLYFLSKSEKTVIWWWKIILILFAAKILLQLTAALIPAYFWLGEHGLKIFYIHLMLLGFITVLYFVAWHTTYFYLARAGLKLLVGSILFVLISLVLISGWWPAEWLPVYIFEITAIISIFPVIAALVELLLFRKHTRLG